MKPQIGQNVAVYGGFENSLSEHAGVITFVHRGYTTTLSGQLGVVSVRVFLDKLVADRVLTTIPYMTTRAQAVDLNTRGAGYACYPLSEDGEGEVLVTAAPLTSPQGTAAFPLPLIFAPEGALQ